MRSCHFARIASGSHWRAKCSVSKSQTCLPRVKQLGTGSRRVSLLLFEAIVVEGARPALRAPDGSLPGIPLHLLSRCQRFPPGLEMPVFLATSHVGTSRPVALLVLPRQQGCAGHRVRVCHRASEPASQAFDLDLRATNRCSRCSHGDQQDTTANGRGNAKLHKAVGCQRKNCTHAK